MIGTVRVRPAFHPELGLFFRKLRTDRGWTMRQAATIAAKRPEQRPLTRQVLLRIEGGQIKNPEPDVLRALAGLYKVDYEALVGMFFAQRYGIDIGPSGGSSYTKKVGTMTPPVRSTDPQSGSAPSNPSSTGDPHAPLVAPSGLPPSHETAAEQMRATIHAHWEDLKGGRAEAIIEHANWIVQLADGLRGLDRVDREAGPDTPPRLGGDPPIRQRRTGTHDGGKRSSGDGGKS